MKKTLLITTLAVSSLCVGAWAAVEGLAKAESAVAATAESSYTEITDGTTELPNEVLNATYLYKATKAGKLTVSSNLTLERDTLGNSSDIKVTVGNGYPQSITTTTGQYGSETKYEGSFYVEEGDSVFINVVTLTAKEGRTLTCALTDIQAGETSSNPIVLTNNQPLTIPVATRSNPVWYSVDLANGDSVNITSSSTFNASLYEKSDLNTTLATSATVWNEDYTRTCSIAYKSTSEDTKTYLICVDVNDNEASAQVSIVKNSTPITAEVTELPNEVLNAYYMYTATKEGKLTISSNLILERDTLGNSSDIKVTVGNGYPQSIATTTGQYGSETKYEGTFFVEAGEKVIINVVTLSAQEGRTLTCKLSDINYGETSSKPITLTSNRPLYLTNVTRNTPQWYSVELAQGDSMTIKSSAYFNASLYEQSDLNTTLATSAYSWSADYSSKTCAIEYKSTSEETKTYLICIDQADANAEAKFVIVRNNTPITEEVTNLPNEALNAYYMYTAPKAGKLTITSDVTFDRDAELGIYTHVAYTLNDGYESYLSQKDSVYTGTIFVEEGDKVLINVVTPKAQEGRTLTCTLADIQPGETSGTAISIDDSTEFTLPANASYSAPVWYSVTVAPGAVVTLKSGERQFFGAAIYDADDVNTSLATALTNYSSDYSSYYTYLTYKNESEETKTYLICVNSTYSAGADVTLTVTEPGESSDNPIVLSNGDYVVIPANVTDEAPVWYSVELDNNERLFMNSDNWFQATLFDATDLETEVEYTRSNTYEHEDAEATNSFYLDYKNESGAKKTYLVKVTNTQTEVAANANVKIFGEPTILTDGAQITIPGGLTDATAVWYSVELAAGDAVNVSGTSYFTATLYDTADLNVDLASTQNGEIIEDENGEPQSTYYIGYKNETEETKTYYICVSMTLADSVNATVAITKAGESSSNPIALSNGDYVVIPAGVSAEAPVWYSVELDDNERLFMNSENWFQATLFDATDLTTEVESTRPSIYEHEDAEATFSYYLDYKNETGAKKSYLIMVDGTQTEVAANANVKIFGEPTVLTDGAQITIPGGLTDATAVWYSVELADGDSVSVSGASYFTATLYDTADLNVDLASTQYGEIIEDENGEPQSTFYIGYKNESGDTKTYYICVSYSMEDATDATVAIIKKGQTTGINSVDAAKSTVGKNIFDMSGRKVNAERLSKGLYIINGKKVVVK